MQNLGDWIEAQLKRGYSISQIKSVLSRKGYPPKAVAEVDKIMYPKLSGKKTPKVSYKAFIGIIIVIGILVWTFNAFSFFQKQYSPNIAAGQKADDQAAIEDQAEQLSGELQPVNSYEINDTGNIIAIYSGRISKVSATSITLESDGRSKVMPISKETPPDYIVGKFGDTSVKRIVLTEPPGVGATVTHLFLLTSPSGEKYVSGVFIKPE